MFGITEQDVIDFFVQSAYAPWTVYLSLLAFMLASSFGLPVPEEVPLIGAGLVGYIAQHPEQYPPPFPGAESVNLYFLAGWCFFAVFASDLVIYFLGRFMGQKFNNSPRFKKYSDGATFKKIQLRIQKNGAWASGIFRFTPGLRFPGHLACGAFGIPLWKFCAVDGLAALVSVPTQILLVGFYGDTILSNFKSVKFAIFGLIIVVVVVKLSLSYIRRRREVRAA